MKSELDYSILQKNVNALALLRGRRLFLPRSARICVTILSFRFYGESPFPSAIWISLNLMKAILTIFKTSEEQLADMLQRIQRTAEKAISVPSAAKTLLVPFFVNRKQCLKLKKIR